MDTELLRVLVAVADHGGLLAAARALRMPKQTMTRRLQALEEQVGVELLRRDRRPVVLSEAGEAFVARCRPVIAELDAALAAARAQREEVVGTLHIAAPSLFSRLFMGEVVARLGAAHPGLTVWSWATDALDPSTPWTYDVVIWIGPLPDVQWRVRELGEASNVLCCAADDVESRAIKQPADLTAARTIHYSRRSGSPGIWLTRGGEQVRVATTPWLVTNHEEVALASALAGQGVASLPRVLVAPHLESGALIELLPQWSVHIGALSVLYRGSAQQTPRLAALLAVLEEVVEGAGLLHRE